jgi:hypothetical protein
MSTLRSSLMAAAFSVAALVSTQAHATLTIAIDGIVAGTDTTNTFTNFSSVIARHGFNITNLALTGVNAFGGNDVLMDVASLEVSTSGVGSLTLDFTETDLTGSPVAFATTFSGTLTNIQVTRKVFLDRTDSGKETTLLYSTSSADADLSSLLDTVTGLYSITEEIDLTAAGNGATLSGDDKTSIPEPASLALIGAGLFGLGVIRRRKQV